MYILTELHRQYKFQNEACPVAELVKVEKAVPVLN
jgi:hypothetical protein